MYKCYFVEKSDNSFKLDRPLSYSNANLYKLKKNNEGSEKKNLLKGGLYDA